MLPIVERDAWKAADTSGARYIRMSEIAGFVIHHSAGPQAVDGGAQVRSIQAQHLKRPRFVDIGYNFLIDGGGTVYRGRPLIGSDLAVGAHCPGLNRSHIGICLLGCFDPDSPRCDDTPACAQVDALVVLCRSLIVDHRISAPQLLGHRDRRATACPGAVLYGRLDEIRDRIAGRFERVYEITRPTA